MLHLTVLPEHSQWKKFLMRLKMVIMDEVHIYTGMFGSNAGMVIRRLKRMHAYYTRSNVRLQFVCCSATIANPVEHVSALIGDTENLVLVDQDGSPFGEKHIYVWNCLDGMSDAVQMLLFFCKMGIKTLLFCKYRKICEMLLKEVNETIQKTKRFSGLKGKIRSYRGGYTPELRREIESQLFSGELSGIISTNALELGIDIGELDVTLHLGFPFSTSSFWQQAGRAGRRVKSSCSILFTLDNPLDKRIRENPEFLFGNKFERAIISPETSPVFEAHLQVSSKRNQY
jgi:DEAD/DEAH box helicase domain-containing protein